MNRLFDLLDWALAPVLDPLWRRFASAVIPQSPDAFEEDDLI